MLFRGCEKLMPGSRNKFGTGSTRHDVGGELGAEPLGEGVGEI